MIAEGLTRDLLFAGAVIFVFSIFVSSRVLKLPWTILVAIMKVGLLLGYFAWADDGRWYLLDDVTYLENGLSLQDTGFSPFTIFFAPDGRIALENVSGGNHFIYPWWNMLAIHFFGEHYYAPVFMNLGLTFFCGWIVCDMLNIIGFEKRYRELFLVFFLFLWDVLVWSSFFNVKHIFVMTTPALN